MTIYGTPGSTPANMNPFQGTQPGSPIGATLLPVNPGVGMFPPGSNTSGTNNQQFVDGTGAVAQSANGPTPTGTETLTSGPVSGATTTANVTFGSTFQG
jgi:hypothetical protein